MSKTTKHDDMRPEYDFSGGVRGEHHRAYQQGTNVVLLEPDVAEIFKDSESIVLLASTVDSSSVLSYVKSVF